MHPEWDIRDCYSGMTPSLVYLQSFREGSQSASLYRIRRVINTPLLILFTGDVDLSTLTPSTPSRHSTSSEDSLPPSPIMDLGFNLGIDELLDEEIRDFIEYNPISPPTTSPESTPPPRMDASGI